MLARWDCHSYDCKVQAHQWFRSIAKQVELRVCTCCLCFLSQNRHACTHERILDSERATCSFFDIHTWPPFVSTKITKHYNNLGLDLQVREQARKLCCARSTQSFGTLCVLFETWQLERACRLVRRTPQAQASYFLLNWKASHDNHLWEIQKQAGGRHWLGVIKRSVLIVLHAYDFVSSLPTHDVKCTSASISLWAAHNSLHSLLFN